MYGRRSGGWAGVLALMIAAASAAAAEGVQPPDSAAVDTLATPWWTYELEEVTWTAGRLPVSIEETGRSVARVEGEALRDAGAASPADLLAGVSGVDVRRRGAMGAQADVGVRGGTFEQTLVLVDGVEMNDPQTGHHTMNLPLATEDIARIEVLRGPAAAGFGPNAMAGVVNVITRRPQGTGATAGITLGQHRLAETSAGLSHATGPLHQRLSVSRTTHAGYTDNTELAAWSLFWRAGMRLPLGAVDLSAGWARRAFGANRFYSDTFPDQREETEAAHVKAGWRGSVTDGVELAARAHWRRHEDLFILDRYRPGWYRNDHTSRVFGAELESRIAGSSGVTSIGLDLRRERLTSSSLGNRARDLGGAFAEHTALVGAGARITGGAYLRGGDEYGWSIWPSANLAAPLHDAVRLHLSVGTAYRVPSFTELYYNDPANVGNPDLQPERAFTVETGLSFGRTAARRARVTLFRRHSENLIDWVRSGDVNPWRVRNIAEVTTWGVEIEAGWRPEEGPVRSMTAGYSWLEADRSLGGLQSKQALIYLRHQLTGAVVLRVPGGVHFRSNVRWQDRVDYKDVLLLDARVSRSFGPAEVFICARNLLDTEYVEVGRAPMPGRWITLGARLSLDLGGDAGSGA